MEMKMKVEIKEIVGRIVFCPKITQCIHSMCTIAYRYSGNCRSQSACLFVILFGITKTSKHPKCSSLSNVIQFLRGQPQHYFHSEVNDHSRLK